MNGKLEYADTPPPTPDELLTEDELISGKSYMIDDIKSGWYLKFWEIWQDLVQRYPNPKTHFNYAFNKAKKQAREVTAEWNKSKAIKPFLYSVMLEGDMSNTTTTDVMMRDQVRRLWKRIEDMKVLSTMKIDDVLININVNVSVDSSNEDNLIQ